MSRLILDDATGIDDGGLVRGETVAAWQAPAGPVAWAVEDWLPEPEIVAQARLGEWEAVLARVGRHAQLGVRHDGDRPAWHGLSKSPDDMSRGAIGAALLAPGRLADVTAVTGRESFTGIHVPGAHRVQQLVVPRIVEHPQGDEMEPAEARFAVGAPPAQAPAAPLDLPEDLTASLLRRLRRTPVDVVRIAVGLHVAETWELPDGFRAQVVYDVAPGRTQGYVLDPDGTPHSTLQPCRNHHLAGVLQWCTHCLRPTCAACTETVRACALCQGAACGDCVVTEDGRCRACAVLAKVGIFARGRFGVTAGGAAWHGESTNVQVTVRRQGTWWTLERWDRNGRVTIPLAPEQVHSRYR
ncbi:hypothetical protein GCM10010168_78810 [Actinoplanes ianthinogenes]|uniref:Thiosulfate sulfurtransferase n=1 Tax=Actinoplanes ianthinogenes TaxID=122358 RepID=A0ABM7LK99_9ACTN|nr:hypothetical protein [Actinoplanes ianthinogenes]BCJ39664.1 hypothetical protein Aiant_03210 [Actinoplanes ianthinogenes]GGR48252.1 hypothetical protein GCM10010168_78810 [Actinoplanes ianthinogenes]